MTHEDKLRYWMCGIGLAIVLAVFLAPVIWCAPYEFALRYPNAYGASSVLARALQLGETQTDSTFTNSFPDDTSITLDTRYTWNLRFIWIYPGPDTQVTEMQVPALDTNTITSYNWTFDYLTSGGFDSVYTRWLISGVTPAGSFWVTTFPFDTAVALNPSYYYKVEYDWYDDTSIVYTDQIIPPMIATADFIWPSSPGLVNLFCQYSRNGSPYEGATLWVSNPKVATDTSTGQVIGPFVRWDVTDSVGVASVQVVPSPYYHDSLKSVYDIRLYVSGVKVKEWPKYYIPNQDTVRLIVRD